MLSTSGYAEHFLQFTRDMIEKTVQFEVKDSLRDYWETMKDKYRNNFKSATYGEPWRQVFTDYHNLICHNGVHKIEDLAEELERVGFEDVVYFGQNWLKTIHVEVLVVGNVS
jgi:secreted Zn-dependent insulinase-like peptidase